MFTYLKIIYLQVIEYMLKGIPYRTILVKSRCSWFSSFIVLSTCICRFTNSSIMIT